MPIHPDSPAVSGGAPLLGCLLVGAQPSTGRRKSGLGEQVFPLPVV